MLRTFRRMVFRELPRENAMAAQIREICRQMDCVRDCFNMTEDGDLIDAYAYLLLSLEARYRHLLRAARARERAADGREAARQPLAAEMGIA